ncbi:MAG: hypothetical protein QM667_10465 [Asticcacaulis sp.]
MSDVRIEAGLCDLNGRFDFYGAIHKALRRAQGELLIRLGREDFTASSAKATLADLRRLLALAGQHIGHEERFVHAHLDSPALLDHQHDHHRQSLLRLEALIRGIEAAPVEQKPAMGRRLYLVFGHFIAHDLLHMYEEETVAQPQLWAAMSDPALAGLEGAIVGSISPEDNMAYMRLMLAALNPTERAGLLAGVRANAPAAVFNVIMGSVAQDVLSAEEMRDLQQRLGMVEAVL